MRHIIIAHNAAIELNRHLIAEIKCLQDTTNSTKLEALIKQQHLVAELIRQYEEALLGAAKQLPKHI